MVTRTASTVDFLNAVVDRVRKTVTQYGVWAEARGQCLAPAYCRGIKCNRDTGRRGEDAGNTRWHGPAEPVWYAGRQSLLPAALQTRRTR